MKVAVFLLLMLHFIVAPVMAVAVRLWLRYRKS
jgi:hypothetical protein